VPLFVTPCSLKKISIFDLDPSTDVLPARFFLGGEPASPLIIGAPSGGWGKCAFAAKLPLNLSFLLR
jgi:hypothetical protein